MKHLIITLGIVALTAVACNQTKIKGSFTQDELDWLVYDEGEKVVFVNKADTTDVLSYTIIDRTDSDQIKEYYPIEAEVIMKNDSLDQEFKIYLLKDQKAFKRYIKVGEVYRSLDMVQAQNQVLIGNETYDQVYILTEDEDAFGNGIAQVYYNKTFGLLKYVTFSDQHYIKRMPVPVNFETGTIQ